MPTVSPQHSDSGLIRVTVLRRERVTPHMTRVTFGGPELARFHHQGFDQWFRLAFPVRSETRYDNMPQRFGFAQYLKYLTLPKDTRPAIRNYTVRAFRPAAPQTGTPEMDVDFLVHGEAGLAGPWAAAVEPGTEVAFIDQGCGWDPVPAPWSLIAADESGMPAALGILESMPRQSRGVAFIELFDDADRQEHRAPEGVEVHWLTRSAGEDPGTRVLEALRALEFPDGHPYAFAVGESGLATGVRRHLVKERGVPKGNVTFSGYWKKGQAAASG